MKNDNATIKSTMSKINLFLDSSALYAGIISPSGAARVLLMLAEAERITIAISLQVTFEVERVLARKAPEAILSYRQILLASKISVLSDPTPQEVDAYQGIVPHPADVPIVVAAMKAKTDFLVTLNRKHFLDDSSVATRSGLRIGTPGDALAWLRAQLGGAPS
jgi:predicted nucleic acid-binding protein